MTCPSRILSSFLIFFLIITIVHCENKKKKDIRDYNDADIERLYDEWEEHDEDELEEDELPEWKKEPPKVDVTSLNMEDPEGMLKATKKGRSLMMFATVSGNPSQAETEKITQIWQGSLFNANLESQRYVVSDNRVIFMLKDGSLAWEVKDFLVRQERCEEVTIEGKSYPGKASPEGAKDSSNKKQTKEQKDSKKKKKDEKKKSDKKDNASAKPEKSKADKTKSKKTKEPKTEL